LRPTAVRPYLSFAFTALTALTLAACGGSSPAAPSQQPPPSGGTPTPPTQPPANRNPAITSVNTAPGFGIATLTSFAMNASATDPDGDPVTFEWDFGDGSRGAGTAATKTYAAGGTMTITVTASDGRGGTATDRRTVTVGSMTGSWQGTMNFGGSAGNQVASMVLTQAGGVVTGTISVIGFNGRTDPAQQGRIDSNGAIELRWKIDPFLDFTMRGQMDPSGTRISGGLFGSGFNGEAFAFDKR
jgi:hypothetical protein